MALPVAIVVYSDTPIAATSLPSSRTFSASTSTPGTGAASIVGYQWYLLDKPPGSTASLLNDTSVTCTLQDIDLPGSYRLFCVVEDDEGALSFEEPQPVQSTSSPYGFSVPPTSAFAVVTALTRYAGLKKVAYGELQWLQSGFWPVVDAVDILHRDVKNAGSGQPEGVVFITSGDGEVDANGSPARPFNPASAVAAGFTGPWQQAQAALLNLELVDRRPLTIVAMGGIYDEDVDITVEGVLYDEEALYELDAPQWCIFTAGLVSFDAARKFSFSVTAPAGDGIALAALTIAPYIGGLDTTGFVLANTDTNALGIGAAADAQAIVYLTNVTANVGVKTLLTSAGVTFRKCSGDVLLPSAGAIFDEHSAESVEVLAVRRADRSTLGAVTVSVSAGTGYYGCNIDSFTGPANSAKFDLHTAAAFELLLGVFAGGASKSDYLKIGGKLVANDDLDITAGGSGTVTIAAPFQVIIDAETGVEIDSGEAGVEITGTSGLFHVAEAISIEAGTSITIESTTTDVSVVAATAIALTATAGDADITAGGDTNITAGGDTNITADDTVSLTAPAVIQDAASSAQVTLGAEAAFDVFGPARVRGGRSAAAQYRVPVLIDGSTVTAATTGTTPETLKTVTLPASLLGDNGDVLEGTVVAQVDGISNVVTVLLDGTAIAQYTHGAATTATLSINYKVQRHASNQIATAFVVVGNAVTGPDVTVLTKTLTNPLDLVVQGESPAGAGDVLMVASDVKLWMKGPAPADLSISDSGYDYGSVGVGFSADKTFSITNVGATSALLMVGSGLAAPYTFLGGTYPGTGGTATTALASGSTATMVVRFTPAAPGVANDTILIDYHNGNGMAQATRLITGTGT